MSIEDIKAKGLKAWYVKDKKSGKFISNKNDFSYEFVDEPYLFCMSLECLHKHLTTSHYSHYRKDGKEITNIISPPLNINDLEIIET